MSITDSQAPGEVAALQSEGIDMVLV